MVAYLIYEYLINIFKKFYLKLLLPKLSIASLFFVLEINLGYAFYFGLFVFLVLVFNFFKSMFLILSQILRKKTSSSDK